MSHISDNIRTARERLRFDIEEVAEAAHVDASTWRAIEAREHRASVLELQRIARALGAEPSALMAKTASHQPVSTNFKTGFAVDSLQPHDLRVLSLAKELGEIGAFLAGEVGHPVLPGQSIPVATSPAPYRQGYALALEARQVFNLGPEPVDDLIARLARAGVHVGVAAFHDPDIVAATVASPTSLPVIVLSERAIARGPRSLRSILAHELCHVLYDRHSNDATRVVSRKSERDRDIEQRANGFAPNFLAPEAVADIEGAVEDVAQNLVDVYGFSREGAAWHARNIRRLSDTEAKALQQRFVRNPKERQKMPRLARELTVRLVPQETQPLPGAPDDLGTPSPLTRGLVTDLVHRAVAEERISLWRGIQILRLG